MTDKEKAAFVALVTERSAELAAYFPPSDDFIFVLAVVKCDGDKAHLSAGGTAPDLPGFLAQFARDSVRGSATVQPILSH